MLKLREFSQMDKDSNCTSKVRSLCTWKMWKILTVWKITLTDFSLSEGTHVKNDAHRMRKRDKEREREKEGK